MSKKQRRFHLIKHWDAQGHIEVEVFQGLENGEFIFVAEFNNQIFRHTDPNKVILDVKQEIKNSRDLNWIKVIEVYRYEPLSIQADLSDFKLCIKYLAKNDLGEWFENEEAEFNEKTKNTYLYGFNPIHDLETPYYDGYNNIYYKFNQETYDALLKLKDYIALFNNKVRLLMMNEQSLSNFLTSQIIEVM